MSSRFTLSLGKATKSIRGRFLPWWLTLVLLGLFLVPRAQAAPFRFVVLGDSRGPAIQDPINQAELTAIVDAITRLTPKPDFVIFLGDMAYIGGTQAGDTTNLDRFNGVMYPITMNPRTPDEIRMDVNIGNHELYDGLKDSLGRKRCTLFNQKNFLDVYQKYTPQNGPPGYEGLAYTFVHGTGLETSYFAVLDTFHIEAGHSREYWYEKVLKDQRDWLAGKLTQHRDAPFIFVLSHMPMYPAALSMARNDTLDRTWRILDNFKISAYFGAHDHCYDWCYIDSSVQPEFFPEWTWKNKILQIITGRAGAWDYQGATPAAGTPDPSGVVPADAGPSLPEAQLLPMSVRPQHHTDRHTYNFVVVDVAGRTATIQPYGRDMGAYYDHRYHPTGPYKPFSQTLVVNSRQGSSPAPLELLLLD